MTSDWPRAHVANYFSVSEYLVCEACKLAREKEILVPFYKDGEHLQLMPGAKHYVSIAQNFHQQNCLLLCNLNELYQSYKKKFPQHKIGLSKFYEFWSKWCVTVSSYFTHTVCVCTVHQNTKLIADAFYNVINKSIKKCERNSKKRKINRSRWRTRKWTQRWDRRNLHIIY